MKEKIEEIFLAHILTGELRVGTITGNYEEIIGIFYNGLILVRIFIPNNDTYQCSMITYSSQLELPGTNNYDDRDALLDDVRKINKILNKF